MNIALILAAGSGSRIHSEVPKQFIKIKDKPLFMYPTLIFNNNPNIDKIIIVTSEPHIEEVKKEILKYNTNKVIAVVKGGKTRKESTYFGLLKLKELNINDNDIVLIHDAARAMINDQIINQNILACEKYSAVCTAIPAADTIVMSSNGKYITNLLNRDELYINQTPQTFKFDLIFKAHQNALNKDEIYTDDANLVFQLNHQIHFVEGSKNNFKITTDFDLEVFKNLIK